MKLKNVLIVVSDIEESKRFYKELFGLDVILDQGGNVILTEGLVLQDKKIWESFLSKEVIRQGHDMELYFEEPDIDGMLKKLEQSDFQIEYIHKDIRHSWGQRVIRIYDPDRHVVEIGEPAHVYNNAYDQPQFFDAYANMTRSSDGLAGAGEWHQLKPMFPDLLGKTVLDLGCGYGWHCKYAAEQGASEVLGIDLSEKMIAEAQTRNEDCRITYQVCGLGAYEYPEKSWDCVISNLVLHYIEDLGEVYRNVFRTLKPGGSFLFNIEHPVFTAGVSQDWIYDQEGNALYWPIDAYFKPGARKTHFLGCEVTKQHHTLTQILTGLWNCGFVVEAVEEAEPPKEMLSLPGMADEQRRPMMLLVRAKKGSTGRYL